MKRPGRLGILMLAAALSVGVHTGCERETSDTDIKLVSVGEVKALWDRQQKGSMTAVIIMDPRPTQDFAASHIIGARNVQLPHINPKGDRDPAIERFDNIVVYGHDPGSATARGMVKRLLAVGYNHIRFFAGGLKEWKSRGYPTEDAPAPPEGSAPSAETKDPPK